MEAKCLSVVVPTFNEEDVIGECLNRLTGQLDHILEIVVVDNNSTDGTMSIVAEFADRFAEVKMVCERQQGLVHARNAGLDASSGQLVARIDSDTLVPVNWARTIVEFFSADTDSRWAAACGRGEAYGLPYGDAIEKLKNRLGIYKFRRTKKEKVKEIPILYGSNMILRNDTWAKVRDSVSMRRDIFEDVDTGLCINDAGGSIAFIPSITVGVSPRRMETGMSSFIEYMSFLPRTLMLHRKYGYAALACLVYVPAVVAMHFARLIVIRGYDRESATFSPKNFRTARVDRVNP